MTEADSRIAGANGHALQTDGNRNEEESLAEFGRAIGHRSRIAILQALMGGKALSATELAWHADVTAQTATSHLGELMNAGLLYRRKCGRFHYYELYNEEVASLIEQLASSVPVNGGRSARRRVKPELKKARFCYDHLAGELGVAISRRLVEVGARCSSTGIPYLLPGDGAPHLWGNRRRPRPGKIQETPALSALRGLDGKAASRFGRGRRRDCREDGGTRIHYPIAGRSFGRGHRDRKHVPCRQAGVQCFVFRVLPARSVACHARSNGLPSGRVGWVAVGKRPLEVTSHGPAAASMPALLPLPGGAGPFAWASAKRPRMPAPGRLDTAAGTRQASQMQPLRSRFA